LEPFDYATTPPEVFKDPLAAVKAVLAFDEPSRSSDTRLLILLWVKVQRIKIPDEVINEICRHGMTIDKIAPLRREVQERLLKYPGNPTVMAKRKRKKE
jgi:hypothetical protein